MLSATTIRLNGCLLALAIFTQHVLGGQIAEITARSNVLRFDGASQVELANTSGLLRHDSPFTVELWVRALPGKGGQFALLGNYTAGENPPAGPRNRGGQWTGSLFGMRTDFRPRQNVNEWPAIDAGQWFHIAATNEPAGLSMYVNGKRYGERIANNWKPNSLNLRIGKTIDNRSNLQVEIGDLRISSACLYPRNFEPPLTFEKRPDTLVLLDFARPRGKTIADLSGHHHDGTIRGASWLLRDDESVSMPATDVVVVGPLGPRVRHPGYIPRWQRIEVKFSASNLEEYARQLDFFKIELGAVGGDAKQVEYASRFSTKTPLVRSAPEDDEQRLYMLPPGGKSDEFDQQLLRKAGIDISNRLVMKFYPDVVQDHLALIELDHLQRQRLTPALQEIAKTVIEIKPRGRGGGWQAVVAEMKFRPPPPPKIVLHPQWQQ